MTEFWKAEQINFEELGHRTMRECGDAANAIVICGLEIQAAEDRLKPEQSRLCEDVKDAEHHVAALHAQLYGRPDPVNDITMLAHRMVTRIMLAGTALAAAACVVGNMITFLLLGFELVPTFLSSIGMTAVPLLVGHLAYEWIVAKSKTLQVLVVLSVLLLCGIGILKFGQARSAMIDKAVSVPRVDSYVDGANDEKPRDQEPKGNTSESRIHGSIGDAMLFFMIAAEVVLGFLVGRLVRLYTDEDYAAWRNIKRLRDLIVRIRERGCRKDRFYRDCKEAMPRRNLAGAERAIKASSALLSGYCSRFLLHFPRSQFGSAKDRTL
ncbi:MAG TPA: hypothetical protein VI386_08240 [Candidatus Sulfotelmatobacter sp.]